MTLPQMFRYATLLTLATAAATVNGQQSGSAPPPPPATAAVHGQPSGSAPPPSPATAAAPAPPSTASDTLYRGLSVDASGHVGIGTATPAGPLEVVDDSSTQALLIKDGLTTLSKLKVDGFVLHEYTQVDLDANTTTKYVLSQGADTTCFLQTVYTPPNTGCFLDRTSLTAQWQLKIINNSSPLFPVHCKVSCLEGAPIGHVVSTAPKPVSPPMARTAKSSDSTASKAPAATRSSDGHKRNTLSNAN